MLAPPTKALSPLPRMTSARASGCAAIQRTASVRPRVTGVARMFRLLASWICKVYTPRSSRWTRLWAKAGMGAVMASVFFVESLALPAILGPVVDHDKQVIFME